MKAAQPVKIAAWLLIGMNILMAFGSIWIFMRMAPAIEVIIDQNEVSLQSCEKMLAALLHSMKPATTAPVDIAEFNNALTIAQKNVTEKEEPAILAVIAAQSALAFRGDDGARRKTVGAIIELGDINRAAMRKADAKAQQLGYSGAWGVVFMATLTFAIGMMFLHSLRKNLSEPIEEIDAVVTAYRKGDKMRRCAMKNPSKGVRRILGNVNELLDLHDFAESGRPIRERTPYDGPDTMEKPARTLP